MSFHALFLLVVLALPAWALKECEDPDACLDAIGEASVKVWNDTSRLSANVSSESFGSGLIASTFGTVADQARSILVATDGTFILGGRSQNETDRWQTFLMKFRADGILDTRFATTGRTMVSLGAVDDGVQEMAATSDGKFILAGRSHNGTNLDFALWRFQSDGTLDTAFAGTGSLSASLGTGTDSARAVISDTQGRINVVGYTHDGLRYQGMVVRYLSNGSLDTSFSTTGMRVLSFGTNYTQLTSVKLDPLGNFVLVGASFQTNWDVLVARLTSDGQFDTSFSTQGYSLSSFGTGADAPYSVALGSAGKIAGAGIIAQGTTGSDLLFFRFTSNGRLDTSFRTQGYFSTTIGTGDDRLTSLYIGTDGRYYFAGYRTSDGTDAGNDILLGRLGSNGSFDANWAGSGRTITTFSTGDDRALALASHRDVGIFVVGYADNGARPHYAIGRYNYSGAAAPSGSLDRSFGTLGVAAATSLVPYPNAFYMSGAGKLPSGGYVILAHSTGASDTGYAARYLPNGQLDTSFRTTGASQILNNDKFGRGLWLDTTNNLYYVPTNLGRLSRLASNGVSTTTVVNTVSSGFWSYAVDATRRMYAMAKPIGSALTIKRYHSNGGIDTAFSTTGTATITNYTYYSASGRGPGPIIVQTSGHVVFAETPYSTSAFADENLISSRIIRLTSNGTMDTYFGISGVIPSGSSGSDRWSIVTYLALDTTGAGGFIAGSGSTHDGIMTYAFTKYQEDGTLDTSFGNLGSYEYASPNLSQQNSGGSYILSGFAPLTLYPAPGNKYIGHGWVYAATSSLNGSGVSYRLNSNFSLDTSFGTGGVTAGGYGNSQNRIEGETFPLDFGLVLEVKRSGIFGSSTFGGGARYFQ